MDLAEAPLSSGRLVEPSGEDFQLNPAVVVVVVVVNGLDLAVHKQSVQLATLLTSEAAPSGCLLEMGQDVTRPTANLANWPISAAVAIGIQFCVYTARARAAKWPLHWNLFRKRAGFQGSPEAEL